MTHNVSNLSFTDSEISVLLGIYKHQTIREMATYAHKSIWAVQKILSAFEVSGHIRNERPRQARTRCLTLAGMQVLQSGNYV